MKLDAEMTAWLTANKDSYEFFLLHAMLHNSLRRSTLLSIPIEPDDFGKEEHVLIMTAIKQAVKICTMTNTVMPFPPDRAWMSTFVNSAAHKEGMDTTVTDSAIALLEPLLDPVYSTQWEHINTYLEAWLTTARGRQMARRILMAPVADMESVVSRVQRDIGAVAIATAGAEEDPMMAMIHSQSEEKVTRRSTGIPGLDECLNGGWGDRECYLIFGGTGAGKSILAAQCAWFEAFNDGWPLVVSTELSPHEYVARIVSAASSVYINHIQDCVNFAQIRHTVASTPGASIRLPLVESVLDTIAKRLRIAKVSADDGMDARGMLNREAEKYASIYGRMPTLVMFDWLGSMADVGSSAGTSERAMKWEYAANGCVKFAETSGIPTAVLAQAVNDSQTKPILMLQDIGISKGIAKNMVAAVGITNSINRADVVKAMKGEGEMPKMMFNDEQFLSVVKARKGEGSNIRVTRNFKFQRFESDARKR